MRYRIVQANEPEGLSEQVEELLNDGWKLHGSLLLTPNLYTQALIDEQDPPAERPAMTEAKESRTLAELLNVSEDQLPPNTAETRRELAQWLSTWETERDAKKPDTDSD